MEIVLGSLFSKMNGLVFFLQVFKVEIVFPIAVLLLLNLAHHSAILVLLLEGLIKQLFPLLLHLLLVHVFILIRA